MKEVFVALIFLFNASDGQLIGSAVAATESQEACEILVASAVQKAQSDMTIAVEAGCVPTILVPAK